MTWPWANYLTFLNPRTLICQEGNHHFYFMEFHQSQWGWDAHGTEPGTGQCPGNTSSFFRRQETPLLPHPFRFP